jgi:hypothetical protein
MNDCMITFRSVTPAQRGEKALHRAGFTCSIQRTPRWMEEQGCGYSLRIRCQDVLHCTQILTTAQIPFRKVYRRRENGKLEDMSV